MQHLSAYAAYAAYVYAYTGTNIKFEAGIKKLLGGATSAVTVLQDRKEIVHNAASKLKCNNMS